eukprot:3699298-Alexandrium_andersonii.AAC.1
MGGIESLEARLPFDPVRPANVNGLGRRGRVDVHPELCAQPHVATPEVGPGPARQAAELVRPAKAAPPCSADGPERGMR